jgi:surface protein
MMETPTSLLLGHRAIVPQSTKHVIFTDQPAPPGSNAVDVSVAQDGGVVLWREGDTYCFSSQRPGVKILASNDASQMFAFRLYLEDVDVTMLDVSHTAIMDGMFFRCTSLRSIFGLDSWNTENVESMEEMFCHCEELEDVSSTEKWDVSKVQNMAYMFSYCPHLSSPPSWYSTIYK